MKPTPADWPRVSVAVFYDDASGAIDWLCRAFGFEVRLKVEGDDGSIHHSELVFGDGVIMVGQAGAPEKAGNRRSPRSLGGANTQSIMIYVDDVDAHSARARAGGATIVSEPEVHDYGEDYWADRGYACADIEGHHWWFCQRVRSRST
jgi:uncharacterized glyoxalase superfamily protein PhnB